MEPLPSNSEIWPDFSKKLGWGVQDLHGVELISISLLVNEQTQAGRKRINVLWLFFFMFDHHWTRVSKNLAKPGHNSDTRALYKALGCKA